MIEISFEYWNKFANQTLVISSLLGGFSIAIVANLIVSKMNTRTSKYVMIAATLASSFFLITVFAMTNLLLMTTEGYPTQSHRAIYSYPGQWGHLLLSLGS